MNSVTGSSFVVKCSNIPADPSFMNLVTGSGFVAICSNIQADLSFMNSVTGSGFVAKCSNILADPSFMSSVTGFVAKRSNTLQDTTTKCNEHQKGCLTRSFFLLSHSSKKTNGEVVPTNSSILIKYKHPGWPAAEVAELIQH
jgi:hypothetical protein